MKIKKIFGKDVVSEEARVIGKCTGAHVDLSEWQITDLEIRLTEETIKELGYKKSFLSRAPLIGSVEVLLPVGFVKTVGDLISVNKKVEELKTVLKQTK